MWEHYSYMCRVTKCERVRNIPYLLNLYESFLHNAGKIPTNFENTATHFLFIRKFHTRCRNSSYEFRS